MCSWCAIDSETKLFVVGVNIISVNNEWMNESVEKKSKMEKVGFEWCQWDPQKDEWKC